MNWQGLLVSVRDAAEAAEAVEGGADIIDVKEPRQGSLGRAEPAAAVAVARVVAARRPWTMACGELGGQSGGEASGQAGGEVGSEAEATGGAAISRYLDRVWSLLAREALPPAAVKIGLAGAAGTDWRRRLLRVFESLPFDSERVAVAYADWALARAPSPDEVIAAAAGLGCSTLLIDTFDKSAGGLFDCCQPGLPAAWVAAARAAGLEVAVAGRISQEGIPTAWGLRPDVVALRSAVCFNGRDGRVQAELVRRAMLQSVGRIHAASVG